MKRQENALLFFLLSGQEGLRKNLLRLGQVALQPFFSVTCCPTGPPLTAVAQPGLLGLMLAIRGQRRCADLALTRLSLGLL